MTDSGSMTNRSQAMVDWLVVKHLAFVDGLRTAMQQAATPAAPVQDDDAAALVALRDTFTRWLASGPNEQPHNPASGMRPFSTGDLNFFVAALDKAIANRLTPDLTPLVEALDNALDFVVDVINDARPGSIHHTNAVRCHEKAIAALRDGGFDA